MGNAAKKIDETEVEETPKAEVREAVKPVTLNRLGLAAEKRNEWVIWCKIETEPEDVLKPEFWEHIARHFKRGDIVEVMPDDLAWEMNVRVLDMGSNWASVVKRHFVEHEKREKVKSELPVHYKIDWAGQTDMFRVTFKGENLKKGFATEKLARQFVDNHASALKR